MFAPAPPAARYGLRSRGAPSGRVALSARGADAHVKLKDVHLNADSTTDRISIAMTAVSDIINSGLSAVPKMGQLLVSTAAAAADPKTYKQAMKTAEAALWRAACRKEVSNHINNSTIELISADEVPPGRKLIGMTDVIKTKRDGSKKWRLCVRGFSQIEGVDFNDTFAPTCRSSSLRVLVAIAAVHGCNNLTRVDFDAAYLQGTLPDDEIQYMTMTPSFAENLPEGISAVDEHGRQKVCRVIKPIYGMKQAGHLWHRALNDYLVNRAGFSRCSADPCVYFRRDDFERTLVIGTYVDDLTICSNDPAYREEFVSDLGKEFSITDEGPLADVVNIQIQPNKDGSVTIHQKAYIEKLAETYLGDLATRTQYKNPAHGDLPKLVEQAVEAATAASPDLLHAYQSIVGALLYCAVSTRPDISYAVGMLCRTMTKPTPELLAAAQRVLIYLSITKDLGITFGAARGNRR